MTAIGKAMQTIVAAKNVLECLVFAEMDRVARKYKLSGISMLHTGTIYKKGDREVPCVAIDRLESLLLTHVHCGGFEALWTPEKGWQ